MTVVDTHCHTGLSWFEPVESLLFQMETNGVDKAAIIQHRGAYDNSYVCECMRRNPGKFAAVVQVDVSRPDAPTALEKLAGQGASGVRLMPTTRSPGADPLAIWRASGTRAGLRTPPTARRWPWRGGPTPTSRSAGWASSSSGPRR